MVAKQADIDASIQKVFIKLEPEKIFSKCALRQSMRNAS